MSASPTFTFCLTQFDERAAEYVAAANPVHRAEFQADVDGARRVLLSEHFAKFRKDFPPDPPTQRTVLGTAVPTR